MLLPIFFGLAALLGLAAFVAYSLQQPKIPKGPNSLESTEAPAPRLAFISTTLRRFRKKAERTHPPLLSWDEPEPQEERREAQIARLPSHTVPPTRTNVPGAPSALNEEMVHSLEQRVGTLANRLLIADSEFETLSDKLRELEQRHERVDGHDLVEQGASAAARLPAARPQELEEIRREIEEAGRQALQAATADLSEKIKKEVDSASSSLVEETRRRVQNDSSAAVEAFSREAGARLRTLEEERLSQFVAGLQAQTTQQAQWQIDAIQKAAREAQQELKTMADTMGSRLAGGEVNRGVAPALTQVEDACQRADAAVSNIALSVDAAATKLQAVAQKAEADLVGVAERMRKVADDLLKSSAGRLEEEANQTAERLSRELRDLETRLIEETNNQLAAKSDAEVNSRVARVAEQARDACQRADAAVSNIALSVDAAANKLHAVEQKAEANLLGVTERMRKVADDLLKSSASRLEERANQTTERLSRELRALETRLIEETNQQLAARPQASLEFLTEQATTIVDECRRQLRQTLDECVLSGVRQLEAECEELVEGQRAAVTSPIDLRETPLEELRSKFLPTPGTVDWKAILKVAAWVASIASFLLFIFFVFLSMRPVMRLRPDPPVEFFDQRPDWSTKRRATEERLARAYWESAGRYLQSRYEFGAKLSDDPPVEFKAEATGLPVGGAKG